jgi:hypothetical protein
MRLTLALTALTLAVLMTGCTVRSLNPLYTEKDVVFEPGLLGTWAEDDNADNNWTIQKSGQDGYRLVSSEGIKTLEGRMVKLGGHLFLDVTPKDGDNDFAIPAHVFVKIELSGDTMRTAILNPDLAEKQPGLAALEVTHIRINDKAVLTAPTKELQSFVIRYAGDGKVFSHLEDYRRTAIDLGR